MCECEWHFFKRAWDFVRVKLESKQSKVNLNQSKAKQSKAGKAESKQSKQGWLHVLALKYILYYALEMSYNFTSTWKWLKSIPNTIWDTYNSLLYFPSLLFLPSLVTLFVAKFSAKSLSSEVELEALLKKFNKNGSVYVLLCKII